MMATIDYLIQKSGSEDLNQLMRFLCTNSCILLY
jgi:hypothetical protein